MDLSWLETILVWISALPPGQAVLFWSVPAVLLWAAVFLASTPRRPPPMPAMSRPREWRMKIRG